VRGEPLEIMFEELYPVGAENAVEVLFTNTSPEDLVFGRRPPGTTEPLATKLVEICVGTELLGTTEPEAYPVGAGSLVEVLFVNKRPEDLV
jgi:hypothetical protein